jgi:TonB family protein
VGGVIALCVLPYFAIQSSAQQGDAGTRIRVAGSVQQAKLLRQPRPVYPPLAKQARISGVVKLDAIIGKDGTVQNLKVSSGHPLLVPASMEAVKQWVYQPTLVNGEAVEVVTQIDVNFTFSQDETPSVVTSGTAQETRPKVCLENGKGFVASELSFNGNVAAVLTKPFTATPVHPLKNGEKIPAVNEIGGGESVIRSISKADVQVGKTSLAYPIASLISEHALITAVLKANTDIRSGETLNADGYQIRAGRAVKAGDAISVFRIVGEGTQSFLSIEAGGDGEPWFLALEDDAKPEARASAIQVWRIANRHFAQGTGACGF